MEYNKSIWQNEFEMLDFRFEDRRALVIKPSGNANGKWMLKTEYFGAFPGLEKELLRRGFHLTYLENHNRLGTNDDLDAKVRFRDFLMDEFGLSSRCAAIGMSCGGLHAIKQAARHPGMISVLYLDAPVVNLLSWPLGLGSGGRDTAVQETLDALGLTMKEFMSYRDHPLDHLAKLISCEIPAALVCGDSDTEVPFDENGIIIKQAYENSSVPFLFELKPNCDHHPHGPNDVKRVADFIERYA